MLSFVNHHLPQHIFDKSISFSQSPMRPWLKFINHQSPRSLWKREHEARPRIIKARSRLSARNWSKERNSIKLSRMKYFDEVNKIWSGAPAVQIFNPKASVGQVVLWSLQRNPNKVGQVRNFFSVFFWWFSSSRSIILRSATTQERRWQTENFTRGRFEQRQT